MTLASGNPPWTFAALMARVSGGRDDGGLLADSQARTETDDLTRFVRRAAPLLQRAEADWPAERILLQLGLEEPATSQVGIAARAWRDQHPVPWTIAIRSAPVNRADSSGVVPIAALGGPARGALWLSNGAVASWGGKDVVVTDVAAGATLGRWQHDDDVVVVQELPDGSVVSTGYDGSLAAWEPASKHLERVMVADGDPIASVALWRDQGIVAGTVSGVLFLWKPDDGHATRFSADCDSDAVWKHQAFVIVDDQLVSFAVNSVLARRYFDDPAPLVLAGHTDSVNGVLALGDGRVLSWSEDGTLRIWDATQHVTTAVLTGHTGAVVGATSGGDDVILSWSSDRTVRLWSTGGEALGVLVHDTPPAHARRFDGNRIGSVAPDGVRLWAGLELSRSWPVPAAVDIQAVGDQLVAIAKGDPALHVLDPATGISARVAVHAKQINGIQSSTDGTGLLSWSEDATVRMWNGPLVVANDDSMARGRIEDAVHLAGSRVLSAHTTGYLVMRDVSGGQAQWTVYQRGLDGFTVVDDERVISWSGDSVVVRALSDGHTLLQRTSPPCGPTLVGPEGMALTRARLADSRQAHIWSLELGSMIATVDIGEDWAGMRWLPSGDALLWSEGGALVRWRASDRAVAVVDSDGAQIEDVIALPDWTAAVTSDGRLLVVDGLSTSRVALSDVIKGCVASHDGRLVAWTRTGAFHISSSHGSSIETSFPGRGARPVWVGPSFSGAVAVETDGTVRYVTARASAIASGASVQLHACAVSPRENVIAIARGESVDFLRLPAMERIARWHTDAAVEVYELTEQLRAVVSSSRGEVMEVRLETPA